jgi:hypothetical protein
MSFEDDLVPNWTTFVVEIGVGIGIAWWVNRIYKKQKNKRLDEVSESLTRKLIPLVVRSIDFVQKYEKKSNERYRIFDDSFWDEIISKWNEFQESNKLLDDVRMTNPNIISLKLDDELRELSRLIKSDLNRAKYDETTQKIYTVSHYAENCLGRLRKYADIMVRERRLDIDNSIRSQTEKTNATDPQLKAAANMKELLEDNLKELTRVLTHLEKRGFSK